ncbi:MAG: rod-binding protein [Acetobacteraceae bacterium]|nr:rod-binding protein [Acetobacteraceae bacterium]
MTALFTLAPAVAAPARPVAPAPGFPRSLRTGVGTPAGSDPAKLMQTARNFEAMAIGQLLQPMFDTVDTAHGLFGGGAGEEAWKPMMVTELAKQIEGHGGLGLAAPIYAAMLRMQEDKAS